MTRNHAKTELGWNIRSHLLQVCTHCLTEHSNAKELLQYLEGILPRRKAGSSNVKGKGPSGRSSESNRREKGMYNVSHMIRHYVPVILPWFTYISSGKHREILREDWLCLHCMGNSHSNSLWDHLLEHCKHYPCISIIHCAAIYGVKLIPF